MKEVKEKQVACVQRLVEALEGKVHTLSDTEASRKGESNQIMISTSRSRSYASKSGSCGRSHRGSSAEDKELDILQDHINKWT